MAYFSRFVTCFYWPSVYLTVARILQIRFSDPKPLVLSGIRSLIDVDSRLISRVPWRTFVLMPSWEYKQVTIKTRGGVFRQIAVADDIESACNTAGRDGWELASAMPLGESHGRTGVIVLLFKRPR